MFGEAGNDGDRRTDVVRDESEKLALQHIELFKPVDRPFLLL